MLPYNDITIKQIDEKTFMLTDLFNDHFYLLLGDSFSLLFDGGIGNLSSRQEIRKLTDKPVIHVLSHGHIDHLGCTTIAEKVYLSKEDADLFKSHLFDSSLKEKFIRQKFEQYGKDLSEEEKEEYLQLLLSQPVNDQWIEVPDRFDLGGRTIEVMKLPGHTKGSICLYDPDRQYLFSGDSICDMTVLLCFDESASLETYYESLKKLKPYPIQQIFNGHHQGIISAEYLEKYLHLIENINDHNESGRTYSYDDISLVLN